MPRNKMEKSSLTLTSEKRSKLNVFVPITELKPIIEKYARQLYEAKKNHDPAIAEAITNGSGSVELNSKGANFILEYVYDNAKLLLIDRGSSGGKSRSERLTAKRRQEIAKNAAQARWAKRK